MCRSGSPNVEPCTLSSRALPPPPSARGPSLPTQQLTGREGDTEQGGPEPPRSRAGTPTGNGEGGAARRESEGGRGFRLRHGFGWPGSARSGQSVIAHRPLLPCGDRRAPSRGSASPENRARVTASHRHDHVDLPGGLVDEGLWRLLRGVEPPLFEDRHYWRVELDAGLRAGDARRLGLNRFAAKRPGPLPVDDRFQHP